VHSIRYDRWYSEGTGDDEVFYRPPNHLNPVQRDLARAARFPDRSHGEDHEYSMRLRPLLRSERFLEGPIYFYRAETCTGRPQRRRDAENRVMDRTTRDGC